MDNRTCKHCDGAMPSSYPNRVYCTATCRNAASWSRRSRLPCVDCGGDTGWSTRADVDASTVHCNACRLLMPRADVECEHCGGGFKRVKRSAGRGGWTRFCSKSCARRAQISSGVHPFITSVLSTEDERQAAKASKAERSTRRRRARLAGVESEPYTRQEIAERDEYRCGICGEGVDMTLKYPDPMSASVDHVIPLSLPGATDLKSNVRLAHLGENVSRGNRLDWTPSVAS